MLHRHSIILVLTCFAALFLACFSPVFFRDEQFGFRDAAHYYYPLYQRVQQEWDAGRCPLWETEENAGMPLLGNPTAAVLYPLKVIYAVFPYAWGARLYIVAHTALAFVAMLVLMRSWRTSWIGSGLSALAYAFGAPVLFQYCNVIFLVGAAWLPLGVHAVDRWVRRGRRWGVIELAVVLAMQTLGGDPQSAYLLGLAAVGYAAGLAWHRAAARREAEATLLGGDSRRSSAWRWAGLVASLAVVWIAMTLVLGSWVPKFRPGGMPPKPLPWMPWVPGWCSRRGWPPAWASWCTGRSLTDGGTAGGCRWGSPGWDWPDPRRWRPPCLPRSSCRSSSSPSRRAGPPRRARTTSIPSAWRRCGWRGCSGPISSGPRSAVRRIWGDLVSMPGIPPHVWVPSLYLGGMTIVLAAGAFALRRTSPWRAWVSVIFLVSLVGSLGQYTSPIWLTRVLAEGTKLPALQSLARELGPLDPEDAAAIRQDGYLRDGDGSIYWLMATFLPGFRQFRYPAKLFTFTSLGLAVLAGVGWDSIRAGASRRLTALTAALLAFTVVVLAGVLIGRDPILAKFRASTWVSLYGPFDPDGAYVAMVRGLGHAAVVLGLGLAAIRLAGRRPMLAGALVLGVATADLAVANRHYVLTVPQSTFEGTPEILRVIEEAERANPSPGPFRVHRLPAWEPATWHLEGSADRGREVVKWERDTLQPKYGIPLGVHYAHVMGVAELYDYEWYYGGFRRKVRDADVSRLLNVKIGDEVVYFPRRTFNMWNVRYFIVPLWPNGWKDGFRGYASMLLESEEIYPGLKQFNGPGGAEALKRWTETRDIQVFRNRREHPAPGRSTRCGSCCRSRDSARVTSGRWRCRRSPTATIPSGLIRLARRSIRSGWPGWRATRCRDRGITRSWRCSTPSSAGRRPGRFLAWPGPSPAARRSRPSR